MSRSAGWIPCLRVRDAHASAAWYADALGFKTDWEHQFEPNFPFFISVSRGPLTLYLSEHRGDGAKEVETYLYVEDVETLYADLVQRGIAVASPPTTQPWGVREIQLKDPDDHNFVIGMDLPK